MPFLRRNDEVEFSSSSMCRKTEGLLGVTASKPLSGLAYRGVLHTELGGDAGLPLHHSEMGSEQV